MTTCHELGRPARTASPPGDVSSRYLELLKAVLTDTLLRPEPQRFDPQFGDKFVEHYMRGAALTCVPRLRLDHLEECIRTVVEDGIEGDLLEAGVWRGGVVIFMRAVLETLGDRRRRVFAADSFAGLPRPDEGRCPREALAFSSREMSEDFRFLAVEREEVEANFARFQLLDERVRFVSGWFAESLPSAPIQRLAILRLDADFHDSTRDALEALYDRVVPGGYVIVDDYGETAWTHCKEAVDHFRARRTIQEPLHSLDGWCYWWRREGTAEEPAPG